MSSQSEASSAPSGAPEQPWPQSNGIYATYDLHCHCGAIRYTMKISPPLYEEQAEGKERYMVTECNCSMCERNGSWVVHPLAKDVTFTRGTEDRVEYRMGPKKNPHWFCGKCGSLIGTDLTWLMTQVFKDEPRYSINVRMLKDFDRKKLEVKRMEQMSKMPPQYSID